MHSETLSTRQVIFRIAAIILIAEFFIMLVINFVLFKINPFIEIIVDVTLLAGLTIPAIYFWVVKPYINAKDEAIAKVSALAITDPLTSLFNRRHLLIQLQRVMASCSRHHMYGALILIDLDGFKLVNDLHGHNAGDTVLIEIANRIHTAIRSEDIASRVGGDEFVVLIDHLDKDEQIARDKALIIAEKLISLASVPIEFMEHNLQVGASAGINLIRFEHMDLDLAIRHADVAMYRSKKTGKGRATFSD